MTSNIYLAAIFLIIVVLAVTAYDVRRGPDERDGSDE
jgi:hypothetical protein